MGESEDLSPYQNLQSENESLRGQLDGAFFDLQKERLETLKWKRVAQAFYKQWKAKKSIMENDMRTLLQISRRLESFSKNMTNVTKSSTQTKEPDNGQVD